MQMEKVRVPLAVAASDLARICDELDAGVTLDQALVAAFDDTKLALADAVDRRIAFHEFASSALEAARAARAGWDERVQQLKGLIDRFKANTQAVVEAHPDLPYRGTLGRITVQKSPASLQTTFGFRELTPELIEMMGIEPEYYTVKTTYTLDTKKAKEALAAGKSLPWAELTQSNHVRFKKG
jgi:hypothetical protein